MLCRVPHDQVPGHGGSRNAATMRHNSYQQNILQESQHVLDMHYMPGCWASGVVEYTGQTSTSYQRI
jgi:hypothetical protein